MYDTWDQIAAARQILMIRLVVVAIQFLYCIAAVF